MSTERPRGLGRGLGALIPGQPTTTAPRRSATDVFFGGGASGSGSTDADGADGFTWNSPKARSTWNSAHDSAPPEARAPDDGASSSSAGSRMSEDADGSELVPVPGADFAEVPVDRIRPNPRQPRQVFDEDDLADLVHSVREIGVLQPVVVRPLSTSGEDGAGEDVAYELVMGERRWRASKEAGHATVPAIIRHTTDDDLLRDALLENLHRAQLNPLEEAAAYQQLLEDFGCTHEELATRIGRSRPRISNAIRLLKLPPLVQRRVAAGVLSAGHARALLGLPDGGAMERMAQRIVAEGLSVRSLEEIIALGDTGDDTPRRRTSGGAQHHPELDRLAGSLADRLDTRVNIRMGKHRGRLTVEFSSPEDLERILEAWQAPDQG